MKIRLSVNLKVAFGLLALLVSVMFIGYKVFDATNQKSLADEKGLDVYKFNCQANKIRVDVEKLSGDVYQYNFTTDEDDRQEYVNTVRKLKDGTENLVLISQEQNRTDDYAAHLKRLTDQLPDELEQVEVASVSDDEEEVDSKEVQQSKFIGDEILENVSNIRELLTEIDTTSREELAVMADQAQQGQSELIWWIIFGTFLCSLMAVFTALIVMFWVTRPLVKVTRVIEAISRGNLSTSIDDKIINTNDEVGDLARAFSRTMVSLKLAMKKTQQADKEESSQE